MAASKQADTAVEKLQPNLLLEDQNMEMNPVVAGTPAFSSPDPTTDSYRMFDLSEGSHGVEGEVTPEGAREAAQAIREGETPFTRMTVDQLKAYAGSKGIDLGEATRKDEIRQAVLAHEAESMKATDFTEQIKNAQSLDELDEIEEVYAEREESLTTVDNALEKRRAELSDNG